MFKKKLAIYINDICNKQCAHCYVKRSNKQYMHLKTANKIIQYINTNTKKYETIIFVGGEPMITPSLISLFINNIKDKNISYGIMTNGTISPRDLINDLNINLNRLTFNISFNNIDDVDNNLKIKTLTYLKSLNINCNILIVNLAQKINNLFDLLKYSIKLSPNYIKVLREHYMSDIWSNKDIQQYISILPKLFHLMLYCKLKYKIYNQISLPNKIDISIENSKQVYKDFNISLVDQDTICNYDIVGTDGKQYLCDGACGAKKYSFGYIWDTPNNPYIIKNFGYQDVLYDYCYLAKKPCCIKFDKENDSYRKKYYEYMSKLEELKK